MDSCKNYVLTIASAHFGIEKEKNEPGAQKSSALDEFLSDGNSTVLAAMKANDNSLQFTTKVRSFSVEIDRYMYWK